jgi:hypothetical protein
VLTIPDPLNLNRHLRARNDKLNKDKTSKILSTPHDKPNHDHDRKRDYRMDKNIISDSL